MAIRGGNDRALDILMRRHKDLVRARSGSFFLIGGERDDLLQEGMIGLLKAIGDFDPDRRSSFRVFAGICITRQMMTAIKRATRKKHQPLNSYLPLYMPVKGSDGDFFSERFVSGLQWDPLDRLLAAERARSVKQITRDRLSQLELTVLRGYVGGKSYQDMALQLNCEVKSVDNALQRAKRKVTNETVFRERLA
ncbi:MAG TPA: sigma-70 family RNA polymerase sigma factor [Actinobacteria bacterium]|nr:sigma-70 family RNA polymerase sigma factor [Actinomycetota bacterium]